MTKLLMKRDTVRIEHIADPAVRAAYEAFPDQIDHDYTPPVGVEKHPAGRVLVDRGPERYAFLRGWRAAKEALRV